MDRLLNRKQKTTTFTNSALASIQPVFKTFMYTYIYI